MSSDSDAAHGHALALLRRSASEVGYAASASDSHYASLWARDAAYSSMGGNVSGDPVLVNAARDSLLTLCRTQAANGQIADAYWPARDYWDWGEAGCTDATALFICAAGDHLTHHPDEALQARLWPHLDRAMTWLDYQDQNQFGLIDSIEAADWMDSTLCRSGKVFYVNVLYQRACAVMADLARDAVTASRHRDHADLVRDKINFFFWPEPHANYAEMLGHHRSRGMRVEEFPHIGSPAAYAAAARPRRGHYLSHVQWGRFVDECDTLGNILAVLYGIATGERALTVMQHLHAAAAAHPYPIRTYTRSFAADDGWGMYKAVADPFQGERWRNPPGSYQNGAVWPFIGGLYVVALHRVGMLDAARAEFARLADANRVSNDDGEWGFHEWLHAETGLPGGPRDQTWNAGTFVLARHVLEGG